MLNNGVGKQRIRARDSDGDFFITPPAVTDALMAREDWPDLVWEPACGNGAMAKRIEAVCNVVCSTDLIDRGYGTGGVDFLTAARPRPDIDAIITNPPFSLATDFAVRAIDLGVRKFAFLAPVGFLAGQARHKRVFRIMPPARVWIFSPRQTLWHGDAVQKKGSRGAMEFAWFVWDRRALGGTSIGWIT